MENKINRNTWIWIVVVVVVIGIILYFMFSTKEVSPETVVLPVNTTTPVVEPESTLDVSGDTTGVKAVSILYTDALVKYADRRLQFDASCQASMINSSITYKDNTGIMLDNRSPVAHVIKVGTNYTVKAWGFRIVVLPDVYLKSKTLLVDCDKAQNVATVLVQE